MERDRHLVQCFYQTFSQANKHEREKAIMFIKDQESQEDFLQTTLRLLTLDLTQTGHDVQIKQSIVNWIDKFLGQQYSSKRDGAKKQSRIDLYNQFILGCKCLVEKGLSHSMMLSLCKPLSQMLNHESHQTLRLGLIQHLKLSFIQNPLLTFYYIHAILVHKDKQSQVILNRIYPYFGHMVTSLQAETKPQRIRFYFQVIYQFLSQLQCVVNVSLFQQIVNTGTLVKCLLTAIQSGRADMPVVPLKIMTLLTNIKSSLALKSRALDQLNQANIGLLPVIINSLVQMNSPQSSTNREESVRSNQELVKALIMHLAQLIRSAPDEPVFRQKRRDLVLSIIFPFLMIPNAEAKALIEDNPSEYLHLKEDICLNQESESIASESSKLLQMYADKIDGATTYIVDICLAIIKGQIDKDNSDQQFTELIYRQSSSTKLEVSLAVLSILSYQIQIRKQTITQLEFLVENYLAVFFNPFNCQVSVQFSIFFSIYIDNLFLQQPKQYMIASVIECLIASCKLHPPRAVLLCVYDLFENMLQYPKYEQAISSRIALIGDLISSNIDLYQDQESVKTLKTLLELQSHNIKSNYKAQMLVWLNKLYNKLVVSLQSKQLTQFTIAALNLLDSIMLVQEYQQFAPQIFGCLQPYIATLTNDDNPVFDQLLTVVNRYVETSSDVPKSVSVFIENVEGIIQRNEGCIYSLFRTLCNIITYSKDDAQVHKIYNLGLQSLKDATKTIRSTLNPLEGTLIVHLTVFYHLEKFSQESLKELVLASMEVLNCEYFRHNKCMYGKYILSILQCLRIRFSETTQILTEFSMLDKFYSLVYDPGMYADSYDRKLYTINQIELVYNQHFDQRFSESALRTIFQVLFKHYNSVLQKAKYVDSSDEEEEGQEPVVSDNSKEIFKLYPNPYKHIDQYTCLQDFVAKLKQFQAPSKILQKVVNGIPLGIKQFLAKNALMTQKVQTEDKKFEKRKIYKVKMPRPGQDDAKK